MEQQPISSWSEGDLIRHVAHELRQSTTVALGWSEILARGDFGFTSQEQKQALLDIFHHLKIIAEVNQWLIFGRCLKIKMKPNVLSRSITLKKNNGTMDDNTIANWTEIELIQNIFFELRRSSGATSGLAQVLVTGTLGFTNDKQREVIEMIHREAKVIEEVNRWMKAWIFYRKNNA